MLNISGPKDYRRIVVVNPKGGSGKSTLSVNLSGYLAVTDRKVALIDLDPQGSSSHWLKKRPVESPPIHGVFAGTKPGECINLSVTLPEDTDIAVIDTPASLTNKEIADITIGSHAIIIPVMPSELDIHAASRLIADLLIIVRISRKDERLGIVANRVKERTISFMKLRKFLNRLNIPVIGMIRDSQNYVSTVREGLCIHEMQLSRTVKDLKTWEPITHWLEAKLAVPLSERDLLLPKTQKEKQAPIRSSFWKPIMATAVVLITIAAFTWHFVHSLSKKPQPEVAHSYVQKDHLLDTKSLPSSEVLDISESFGVTVPDDSSLNQTDKDEDIHTLTTVSNVQIDTVAGEAETPVSSESKAQNGSDETLGNQWRLSGVVAHSSGDHIVILNNPSDVASRTLSSGEEVDGWRVIEAGRDFVVLNKDDKEVRLKIELQKE